MSEQFTNEELKAFLAELEQDNPGSTGLSKEDIARLQQEEAEELENALPGQDITSDHAWGWARKENMPRIKEVHVKQYEPALKAIARSSSLKDGQKAKKTREELSLECKRRKQEIINEAINSTFIDLNAPLTVEHKKLLVSLLTKSYTYSMKKTDAFINTCVETALKRVIPHTLLNAYIEFPDTVVPFPGFTYQASEEYGKGLTFKVTPNIPMYFKPEDCTNIVKELLPSDRIATLDKAVAFFHKYKEARTKREISTAEALTKISTFFQLAKKNANWYDTLVQELKKQYNEQKLRTE